jgi:hypothetical protein
MTERQAVEAERYLAALDKINTIRNSIIGLQTIDWSEHIYPLVAALGEAGFEGLDYDEARANFGTMLERTVAAEDRVRELEGTLLAERARMDAVEGCAAIGDVLAERRRQVEAEGWSPEHDDHHVKGDLAMAAALFATPAPLFSLHLSQSEAEVAGYEVGATGALRWDDPWPFKRRAHVRHDLDAFVNDGDTRGQGGRRRDLVKAGALIIAEIERLDRQSPPESPAS